MNSKTFRLLLIFLTFAALFNAANFYIYYILYNTKPVRIKEVREEDRLLSMYNQEATDKKWHMLKTMLACGRNLTDCQNALSVNDSDDDDDGPENQLIYDTNDSVHNNVLKFCPKLPRGLGPVKFQRSTTHLNYIEALLDYLSPGGYFKPARCIPRQSVAIIIPMKTVNRAWKNCIGTFLYYIHPFLMKQLSEYRIFVVVQVNPAEPYARGKLLNCGFMEAQRTRERGWDCLVFHDADLIPTDTRNLYRCGGRARRLLVEPGNQKTFGGAVAMTPSLFKKINGFSNLDWHSDGDYLNMYKRLKEGNYTIETRAHTIGEYTRIFSNIYSTRHDSDTSHATTPIHLIDGLASLGYRVVKTELQRLYTFIQVDFRNFEVVEMVESNKEI